jgi:hypothetical protein
MHFDLENGDYFHLAIVRRGTAGVRYDCQVRAELRCGKFVGETEAWLDGPDVEGFLAELEAVSAQLKGLATLQSDDSFSLKLRLAPVDSLGHFLLEAKLGQRTFIQSVEHRTSVSGTFAFDASALSSLHESALNCFREVANA